MSINPKVLGQLANVYAATINVIRQEISLDAVYAQCGGKCINLIIKSLEETLNHANEAMGRCRGSPDNTCVARVYDDVNRSTRLSIDRTVICLSSVGIPITERQYRIISSQCVVAVIKAVEAEASSKWNFFPFP